MVYPPADSGDEGVHLVTVQNSLEAVNLVLQASDPEGNTLSYTITSQPAHGVLSGTAPALTYTPAANYNGSDHFTYQVNDGALDSGDTDFSVR